PPPRRAKFESRAAYFTTAPKDVAEAYYIDHLLDENARRCRDDICGRAGFADWQPTHAVSVVSKSPSGVALGLVVTGAKRVLLFFEPGNEHIKAARVLLGKCLSDRRIEAAFAQIRLGDRDREKAQIEQELVKFLGDVPPDKRALDLTPGYK